MKRVLHYSDGKLIDEVVADGYTHLERMDETESWIGLEGPGGEQIALWITSEMPIEVRGGINGEEDGVWPEGVEVEYPATEALEGDQSDEFEGGAKTLRRAGERWRQVREADPHAVDRSIEAAARDAGDVEDELEAEAVVEREKAEGAKQLTEAEARWRSAMLDAWFQTRIEADRTLLTLSAGGVALLVTLLTTVGSPWVWVPLLYICAFAAFIVAIHAATAIFKHSADHIMEAANDAAKAHNSPLRKRLRKLDDRLKNAFWVGVGFSIAVGVMSAAEPTSRGRRWQTKARSKRPRTRFQRRGRCRVRTTRRVRTGSPTSRPASLPQPRPTAVPEVAEAEATRGLVGLAAQEARASERRVLERHRRARPAARVIRRHHELPAAAAASAHE